MTDYKHDIEKYLRGELTPAQMHALEKKALSDPFLADALEGIQSLEPEEFLEDLSQLQGSLHNRAQKKNAGHWIWIGRIAAGLLLLAVSTFLIVFISNRSEKANNLALNNQKEESPSPQRRDAHGAVADSTPVQEDDASSPHIAVPEESKESVAIPLEKPTATRSHEEARVEIQQEQELAGEMDKDEEDLALDMEDTRLEEDVALGEQDEVQSAPSATERAERKKEILDDGVVKSAREKSAAGAQTPTYSNKVNRKIIRGKVTYSEDGTGLPGVNVLVKGTNEGTVTDAQGNYQILVKEAPLTLLFSFIGFENQEIEANAEEVNVRLEADVSALSEVVVVGYGSKDIEFLPSTPTVMELAMPEGGRKVFKQYLEENVRYPEEALKNKVEGKVTIQFIIGTTGQLTDFKVIRGIGHGCEDEVIRLIKAGPKWSPTRKNEVAIKDRVRVRMRFALPKK